MNNQITQKWEQTGLLKKTPEHRKQIVSLVLESQYLLNKKYNVSSRFFRLSIPIVTRIMNLMPCLEYKFSYDYNAKKTKINLDDSSIIDYGRMKLDVEAELVALAVEDLKEEINSFMKDNDKESINFLGISFFDDAIYFHWI